MEGNCRQKSNRLAFILTSFILDAWLYFYMHVSCFLSYSFLFFIDDCMEIENAVLSHGAFCFGGDKTVNKM